MPESIVSMVPPVQHLEAKIGFLMRELHAAKRMLPLARLAEEYRQINANLPMPTVAGIVAGPEVSSGH